MLAYVVRIGYFRCFSAYQLNAHCPYLLDLLQDSDLLVGYDQVSDY